MLKTISVGDVLENKHNKNKIRYEINEIRQVYQ